MREKISEFFKEASNLTTREEFTDWLWSMISGVYSSPNSIENTWLSRFESSVEGLASPYENIKDENRKKLFRQAIGDVFLSHGNEDTAIPAAFDDLIYLIARINAVESLHGFVPTLGNGALGKTDLKDKLWWSAMSTLKYLSPSLEVEETVSALADSENFDEGYLLEAIGILVECNPPNTKNILSRFEERVRSLHEEITSLNKEEDRIL